MVSLLVLLTNRVASTSTLHCRHAATVHYTSTWSNSVPLVSQNEIVLSHYSLAIRRGH